MKLLFVITARSLIRLHMGMALRQGVWLCLKTCAVVHIFIQLIDARFS